MNETIQQLLSRMTLVEKIGQLNLANPGDQTLTGTVSSSNIKQKLVDGKIGMMFGTASLASRRRIQEICTTKTRLKIPMLFASDVIHGYRTALPIPLGLSCTWNLEMLERAAHIAAIEARADGIDLTFAPMVDLTRDPRWGRVAEGNGESPTLSAMIARAVIRGYQGDGDKSKTTDPDRVLACVKHFAGYGGADGGREYAAVNIGPVEFHETHLPPFKAAVESGVASLMPGFHTLDRTPVSAHQELLRGILRDRWKFTGAVISDYTAINEMVIHGIGDNADVAVAAMLAGVDLDMVGEAYHRFLAKAVKDGKLDESLVDDACRRVLELKWKAGLFDDPFRSLDASRAEKVIGCKQHRDEARAMAAACCVLLKNNDDLLPLHGGRNTGPLNNIALIGPLADDKANLPGTWSVNAKSDESVSLLTGLREVLSGTKGSAVEINCVTGCNLVDDPTIAKRLNVFEPTATISSKDPEALLDQAVATAKHADIVILAVGEAREHSGECSSRTDLQIPAPQRQLIDEMSKTGKKIVLVVFAGRPLVLTDVVDKADAILFVWYGGSLAGPGIADVLCGKKSPEAKLTMSFPRAVGQIPVHHDALPTGRPLSDGKDFEKFKTCYLDETNHALFPFGFGLSYTQFKQGPVTATLAGDQVRVQTRVTNTGNHDGVEIVQCYQSPAASIVSQPLLKLMDFRRLELKPGEQKKVEFTIDRSQVAVASGSSLTTVERKFVPGLHRFSVGPDSQSLTDAEVDWR